MIETLEDNINEITTPKHINILKIYLAQWLLKSIVLLRGFDTPDFPSLEGIVSPGFSGPTG
jgi:hypothetical protein